MIEGGGPQTPIQMFRAALANQNAAAALEALNLPGFLPNRVEIFDLYDVLRMDVEPLITRLREILGEARRELRPSPQKAIEWAASRGYLEVVNFILLEFPPEEGAFEAYNFPLTLAAENDHLEVVNRLLEFPGIAATDLRGALCCAASRGHFAVVNRLLEFPTATNPGRLVVAAAAEGGHLEVVNLLLESPAFLARVTEESNSAFRRAAGNGHLKVVNRLLNVPAVVADITADDNGALEWASASGHLQVVERLLEFPAVVNALITADNNHALDEAVKHGHVDVVERLLRIRAVRERGFGEDVPLTQQWAILKQIAGKKWVREGCAKQSCDDAALEILSYLPHDYIDFGPAHIYIDFRSKTEPPAQIKRAKIQRFLEHYTDNGVSRRSMIAVLPPSLKELTPRITPRFEGAFKGTRSRRSFDKGPAMGTRSRGKNKREENHEKPKNAKNRRKT